MRKNSTAWIIVLPIIGLSLWQLIGFRSKKDRIDRLKEGDVKAIIVRDRSNRDRAIRFSDVQGVSRIVSSLRNGDFYMPSHDRANGFEFEVTLEPQSISFTTYRHPRHPDAVVVSMGSGQILCKPFAAWQPLEQAGKPETRD